MNTPRRALVLDFGGVISRTLFETHAHTEAALGLPAGTLTWRGPFDPASDALWRALQSGNISERDYWRTRAREVGALLGESWDDMLTLVQRARGADPERVIRPEALTLIDAARAAGCKVAVLSNELDLFYGADFKERVLALNQMDAIIDATYTGVLKPDARAYQHCATTLGLPLAACVFIDDQARNVEGARRAGMWAVQLDVRDPQRAFDAALEQLLRNACKNLY